MSQAAMFLPIDHATPFTTQPPLRIYEPDPASRRAPIVPQVEQEHRLPRRRGACFGIDAVNFHEFARFLEDLDIAADQVFPKEPYPESSSYHIDFYDVEFWAFTPEERERFVRSLTSGPLNRLTIVQSYNLTDEQIDELWQSGVTVVRHITFDVLAATLARGAPGKTA